MSQHYLDYACLGPPSVATVAAVNEAMRCLGSPGRSGTSTVLELLDKLNDARRQVAKLVGVAAGSVLLVENTTRALGLIATSLPLERGDNVLVDELEFLGATVVWRGIVRRRGIEVRSVRTQGGRAVPEHFAARADRRTRALVVSSVQETTGYRCDLHQFRRLADDLGAVLIVDGIQEVGAVPVDLARTPVHAYCAGGHKWLRSPFGLGFLYLDPQITELLDPPFSGYLSLAQPEQGWDAYLQSLDRTAFDHIPEAAGIAKLETGGIPNWFGAIALEHAISELLDFGMESVWARIRSLTTMLRQGLTTLGVQLYPEGAASEHELSGIVTFSLPEGLQAERELLARLEAVNVHVSLRHICGVGGLRVAPHYVSADADIHHLLNITQDFLRMTRRGAAPFAQAGH